MDKKKAAAAAAVAVAAAAGMVTGTVFDNPTDLMQEPAAVVSAQGEDDDCTAPEERQKGPSARIREWVLSLPAAVRMLVGVPLWCLGWVLRTGLSIIACCPAGNLAAVLAKQTGTEETLVSQAVAHSTVCMLVTVPAMLLLTGAMFPM